jgi:hypothetical protein
MLYFYYGEECPHCHDMLPIVDKLIADGTKIMKLETWHNTENAAKLTSADDGKCGGVPFFYNDENKQFICGSTTEERVKQWAEGKLDS